MDSRNVALVVAAYVLIFVAGFLYGVSYSADLLGRSATVYAAAVISGTDSGTLATVTAQVIPGTGRTYITVNPSAELDTQESARIAASVASKLAGKSIPVYDILFTIDAPTPIVGGPSAGAAMTVAAYAALTGKKPRQDVVVTGEIRPDGSIGPVGGLVAKLHACADHGIKTFLIPAGERYVRVAEPVVERESPAPGVVIITHTVQWKTVDLVALGKKLGVRVVEVSNIHQVLPYFFSTK
ncbi:MAG: hypothetical protein GXN93_00420 [Candidatus Diapherotrites archaeon]|nr:hypothetical protein [Candidatus Diapherotrites archaeon]